MTAADLGDVLVALRGVSKHFPIKVAWPRRPGVPPHVRLWRAVSRMPAMVQAVTAGQIKDVLNKYITGKKKVVIEYLPESMKTVSKQKDGKKS